ncbi:hypothetical protein FHP05_14320 [Cerasibacillus terrae]|uniref:Cytosolic protein n=1 Tax=Cerasibacillus terrae TaxID=2498845 RepID=A0A5C8NH76_9BACI|nr:hypothetical protein [Cerasibacillus terrae]TXL58135.1 hypothetical protein FHP05_14320 [Cerasibacillus terrae]
MGKEDEEKYSDFPNVRKMRNELIPEEFPEGTYGSPFNKEEAVTGKSTPWEEGQYRSSAFVYPDKDRHEGLPRQADGAHPLNSRNEETDEKQ